MREGENTLLLRRAGLRATPGKLELVSVLSETNKPLSVDSIVKKMKSSLDQANVYRSLKELKKAGVVRQIDFQHNHAYYELVNNNDHHHLICVNCDRIEDINCQISSISRSVLKETKQFSKIINHSLELFGVCRSCNVNN